MNFDANRIKEEIMDYLRIQEMVDSDDFCSSKFKKQYNHFYRIRQKPESWYNAYYDLFFKCKNNPMAFEEIITELYKVTGELHASFGSKMLATLNPNKPIWDQYVLQWLGFIKNDPKDNIQRIKYYASIYEQIENEYNAHKNDKNIIESIRQFDSLIPEGKNISTTKKIDFMLWSNRSDRTVSIFEYNQMKDMLEVGK